MKKNIFLSFFVLIMTTRIAFSEEKAKEEHRMHGIIENLFGPGDDEFVCYNRVHRNFYGGIFTLAIGLGIAIYARYRTKNSIARKLEIKNAIIEEKNRDITDSINYAKRLQEAILPPKDKIGEAFEDSFILFKPKDIVAGDFYWVETCDDLTFIAAADCTGHGVPGAMVSVVCNNALNRVIREYKIFHPGKILDKTRELVIETFEKRTGEVKDGMDISLCCINNKNGIIKWSGANNSLWMIRNGAFEQLQPDRQPVGKSNNIQPFTTHELQLNKEDCIYLFTDGYADQFGGEKGKKYLSKNFKKSILEIYSKPMTEQGNILNSNIEKWKGGRIEQVDDILVIGFKI